MTRNILVIEIFHTLVMVVNIPLRSIHGICFHLQYNNFTGLNTMILLQNFEDLIIVQRLSLIMLSKIQRCTKWHQRQINLHFRISLLFAINFYHFCSLELFRMHTKDKYEGCQSKTNMISTMVQKTEEK